MLKIKEIEMFLHIGDNCLIKKKDVIGVFDRDVLLHSSENGNFLNQIDSDCKTIIVGESENYFSNIAVATIYKRLQNV